MLSAASMIAEQATPRDYRLLKITAMFRESSVRRWQRLATGRSLCSLRRSYCF
jgi:hypothetical protein